MGVDEEGSEVSDPLLLVRTMEDSWVDCGRKIDDTGWQRITEMARLIYGDAMAVSGVDTETAERYVRMAYSDRDDVPSEWFGSEGTDDERVVEAQGKIILACLEEGGRYPPEDRRRLVLQKMAQDLFENDLFSIGVTPSGSEYVVSSPINRSGLTGTGGETWVIRNIAGKNHITPSARSGMIGRACFSPVIVGIPGAEKRRNRSLRGHSPEDVSSGGTGPGIIIKYTVYEPERLPSCSIAVGTQTDERLSPLRYSLRFDQ
ncbi:MAG: hypothetical protein WC841_03585 [Candidatus Shapirobacteria bacterium]|jgi:hypothetical protein